jgi:hypothetical protein
MKYQLFFLTLFMALMYCGVSSATAVNITDHTNVVKVTTPISSDKYNIGHPVLKDIYVDPVSGNDLNTGSTQSNAIKTFKEAWNRIPSSKVLNQTGYRINLKHGVYDENYLPDNGWMESHYGTYNCPIIIQSLNNSNRAAIKTSDIFNLYNCRYIYLVNLNFESNGNNVVHLERCDHILITNVSIKGSGSIEDYSAPQEDLKANQCHNIFVEYSNISNAWNVPIDFVAVENGHIIGNIIHTAGDWCLYLKGGSSHFIISNNEIYDAKNGGFSAGQGTGFEYMIPPYIHYEAYDIKFINNLIHDTDGAGMGVNGGYNILLAYNTLYRVGKNSHTLEFGHGIRSCGNSAQCNTYLDSGGWGTSKEGMEEKIPNKNVYVYNNIIFNPNGYQSLWSQFSIENPVIPSVGSNIPSPSLADDNLIIKGNIIWNGPTNLPLGIEEVNTTLKENQLVNQNYINIKYPELTAPNNGNFRPVKGSNIFNVYIYPIPDFTDNNAPSPQIEVGKLNNTVNYDYDLNIRITKFAGALTYLTSNLYNPTVITTPRTGIYNKTTLVILKISKSGSIYYTLNGSSPTIFSSKYCSALIIRNNTILKYFAVDLEGNKSPYYTQKYIIDRISPKIFTTIPSNQKSGVSRTAVIAIKFSENIKFNSLFNLIKVVDIKTNRSLIISKTISGNILYIKTSKKSANTTYNVIIPKSSVKDYAGNYLIANYSFKFKTGKH